MRRKREKKNFLESLKNFLKPPSWVKPVYTSKAPEPIGPYSQALRVPGNGWWLVCSGQIPIDPETSRIAGSSVEEQTERVFKNIQAVLSAGNMDWKMWLKPQFF